MARDLKRAKLDPKLHQYRVLSVRGGGAAAEELPANKMVIGSIPAAVLVLTSSDTRPPPLQCGSSNTRTTLTTLYSHKFRGNDQQIFHQKPWWSSSWSSPHLLGLCARSDARRRCRARMLDADSASTLVVTSAVKRSIGFTIMGPRCNYHKGQAGMRHYANQPAVPYDFCVGIPISLAVGSMHIQHSVLIVS